MANKRRVVDQPKHHADQRPLLDPRLFASGFLGAAVVYLAYYPSDAALVESGDALWFCMLVLTIALFTFVVRPTDTPQPNDQSSAGIGRCLDVIVWALAGWMMLAALLNSGASNLRMGTNEAWVWIAGAAMFTSVRRLAGHLGVRRQVVLLMVLCATGLSILALHQELVTLPQNRLEFERDPEAVLAAAGLNAPPGSAEAAIFMGRLYDGGPTGTFALANSLAGVLIAGVLLSAGAIRFTWNQLSRIQIVTWIFVTLVCAAGLFATRSRSAIVATALGLFLIYAYRFGWDVTRTGRRWRVGFILSGSLAALGAIALIANPELSSRVPTSLLFRFQYWRSTLRMVLDRPLFGAGPGNFQSIYERYREPTTAEQIADPHNFLFETLGSGGWIGGLLLVAAIILIARFVFSTTSSSEEADVDNGRDAERAIWIGAVVSLVLVWLFGFATRQLPDVSAAVIALPVVGLVAWLLLTTGNKITAERLDVLVGITVAMVMLHLSVSGGWTVPGVAIVIWIGAGILTRTNRAAKASPSTQPNLQLSWACGACCLLLILLLYTTSLRPTQIAQHQLAIAQNAIETGQYGRARRALTMAAGADRWSPEAILGLANLDRWDLVRRDSVTKRRSWEEFLSEARRRGGDDPTLLRTIGAQQMHLYQRYGRVEDLDAAAGTFETAMQWSPMNQWMIAQLASIEAARGNQPRSIELAGRARELSAMGVNVERQFNFQMIYPAEHYGDEVERRPIRRSAAQVLSEPSQAIYRNGQEKGPLL